MSNSTNSTTSSFFTNSCGKIECHKIKSSSIFLICIVMYNINTIDKVLSYGTFVTTLPLNSPLSVLFLYCNVDWDPNFTLLIYVSVATQVIKHKTLCYKYLFNIIAYHIK